jgi:hypothetical protein
MGRSQPTINARDSENFRPLLRYLSAWPPSGRAYRSRQQALMPCFLAILDAHQIPQSGTSERHDLKNGRLCASISRGISVGLGNDYIVTARIYLRFMELLQAEAYAPWEYFTP